jgi:biopolymer transport protein ExbD
MAKTMKLQISRRRPRIELVPMIDVMFFMLVFFMLFSTLKSAQSGVTVDLPKTVQLGEVKTNSIVISIDKDSQLFLGKRKLDLTELAEKIRLELRKDPKTDVIINPDAVVSYGELIKVMDVLAGAGVQRPLLGVTRGSTRK